MVGYQVVDDFLKKEQCRLLLDKISDFREHHTLPEIHRPMKRRSLRYNVINGEQIESSLPGIWDLYTGTVNEVVNESLGFPLEPLANTRAGVNINLMRPNQSSYRWHYDRACVTSIIYLNRWREAIPSCTPTTDYCSRRERTLSFSERWMASFKSSPS